MNTSHKRRLSLVHLVVLVTAALFCSGCLPGSATVEATGPVEYATTPVDVLEYLVCSDEGATISVQDDLVATTVGTQTIGVEVKNGLFSNTVDVEMQVVDTRAPVIELSNDHVSIEMGETIDLDSCVASVSDPVDGPLSLVETPPRPQGTSVGSERFYDEGWYTFSGEVDAEKPGSQQVEVIAQDQHGNEAIQTINVEVIDPLEGVTLAVTTSLLEYGTGTQDVSKLAVCSDKEAKVKAAKVDLTSVGEQKVTFTITKGKSSHTEDIDFEVRDTKVPVIKLKKDAYRLVMGQKFDGYRAVESVEDPVDGALDASKKAPKAKGSKKGKERFYDKGWYQVTGEVDTEKPGNYEVTVTAYDQHGNEDEAHIKVTVVDPLEGVKITPKTKVLEYSLKETDAAKLVTCSVEGAKVTAKKLSLAKVGKVTVDYTITKGSSTHTAQASFEIRDTKNPIVKLNADEVTIERGGSFDPYGNVASVTDEVDGALPRVDTEPADNGDGWYTITGSYDTNTASKYYLTVTACDNHGNRVTKEFSLLVKAPAVVETGSIGIQTQDNARDYVLNTNTGKFHYPSCRDVSRIKTYNRQNVHMTREEVISMGYVPCAHCNP